MIRVVGTASRKASLSAMFSSYSDFFLIPILGFWYNDLMTLRAPKNKVWVLRIKFISLTFDPYNIGGRD